MLDLSAFTYGGGRRANFSDRVFCEALWGAVAAACPDVLALDLSGNGIDHLGFFKSLPRSAPALLQLSLGNNRLRDLQQLDSLRGYRDSLEGLVLAGNAALQAVDRKVLLYELSSRFNALKELNGAAYAPIIQFALPPALSAAAKLPPVNGSFFESEDVAAHVPAFITKFFEAVDVARDHAAAVYADYASFSLSVARDAGPADLPEYQHLARNFARSPPDSAAGLRVAHGPREVLSVLAKLPASQHDVDNLVVDAVVVPTASQQVLLHVSVQGQFLEPRTDLVRSFYRALVLQPVAEGSSLLAAGWGFCVCNDQLFLATKSKRYNGGAGTQAAVDPATGLPLPAVASAAAAAAAAAGAASGAAAAAVAADPMAAELAHFGVFLPAAEAAVVRRVVAATGVGAMAAVQTLGVVGGDAGAAIAGIQQQQQHAAAEAQAAAAVAAATAAAAGPVAAGVHIPR